VRECYFLTTNEAGPECIKADAQVPWNQVDSKADCERARACGAISIELSGAKR
jgi:hypothetical protein